MRGGVGALLPPKPDKGSLAVAAVLFLALHYRGYDKGTALFVSLLTAVIVFPLLFMARELVLFRPRRVLDPKEAGLVAEWVQEAGSAVGFKGSIAVFYTFRRGLGLQVMQLGGVMLEREEAQAGLIQLIHRAAWSAMPAATRTSKGRLIVAIPAMVMEALHSVMGRGRSGVYLRVSNTSHLKLAYGLVKELVKAAATQSLNRFYVAYLATKALARMVLQGWLRIDEVIAARIDSLIPPEPFWVRSRVRSQLEQEALLSLSP